MTSLEGWKNVFWDCFEPYSVDLRIRVLGNQEKFNNFYSALDSIHDMTGALHEFNYARKTRHPTLLECVGFLQCLFILQDSVELLTEVLNSKWEPLLNKDWVELRDLRNRVVGHPALTDRSKLKSSSFFPSRCVSKDRFEAVIQYEDKWETTVIIFDDLCLKNERSLCLQMSNLNECVVSLSKEMDVANPKKMNDFDEIFL